MHWLIGIVSIVVGLLCGFAALVWLWAAAMSERAPSVFASINVPFFLLAAFAVVGVIGGVAVLVFGG